MNHNEISYCKFTILPNFLYKNVINNPNRNIFFFGCGIKCESAENKTNYKQKQFNNFIPYRKHIIMLNLIIVKFKLHRFASLECMMNRLL